MPSPHSRFVPYYSGRANTFEDFLEEFESLAYDCALTDPQRVEVIIRYVNPSLRDFWRSLTGYHSCDWPQLRQSLINFFGSIIPRPQVMRQRLLGYVQDSSRTRMNSEDDVSQYYRQFLCLGKPLVHSGHLSEEERNAAFWYRFHPEDCEVLRPHLISKNPFQPPNIPFHFEHVFGCVRAAFAYNGYFPSPWPQRFEPSSIRREQPVVEPTRRDTYNFLASTRAVAPYTQLPPSSSILASESQHTQAPLVTVDRPKPAPTLPTTFLPSISEDQLEPKPDPESTSESIIPPSTDHVPEIASTPPNCLLVPPISFSTLSSLALSEISMPDSPPVALLPNQSSQSSLCKSSLLPALNVPISISPRSTSPQRLPGIKKLGSDSSPLEVESAPALSATTFTSELDQPPLVYPSTLTPGLPRTSPPLPLSRSSLARFSFTFVFITTAALVSALFKFSATISTHTREFWSKKEVLGSSQNGTHKMSKSCNTSAQRFRLGQYTPHATRFVFDPGGQSSSFKPLSAHEDVRKHKSKTHNGFTTLDTSFPIPIPIDDLKIFDHGGVGSSLTGDGQDFDPPGGVRLAFELSPKPHIYGLSITSATRPFSCTDLFCT
ncbi:hypothetical protein EDB87DRAFT_1825954 [Lactarius vividus]|nr:hypothetical protein EDB87DRAFT_1825954 [Lactarius vividus]